MHGIAADSLCPPAPALRHAAIRFPVRALSADAAFLDCLSALPRHGRVHSVFERVINIEISSGRLLTLAHRDSDNAPDTVVVDLGSWTALGLTPGIDASLSGRRIVLGNGGSISLGHARPWHGRLPAYAPDDAILCANLPVARDHVERHGKGIGPDLSAGAASTALDTATAGAFRRATRGLCDAIARGDEPTALEHVDRLVGLGPGLTPSGDDFLLGLLAALNLPDSPCRAWRRIGKRVAECARTQTHLISAAALRHAANGRVRASVISLCDALMTATSMTTLDAVDRVLGIGSSSGTEIALGVLAGLRLHLAMDEKRQVPPARHESSGATHGS